jgi:hypothetical protein
VQKIPLETAQLIPIGSARWAQDLAHGLSRLGISANQVSLASIGVAVLGAAFVLWSAVGARVPTARSRSVTWIPATGRLRSDCRRWRSRMRFTQGGEGLCTPGNETRHAFNFFLAQIELRDDLPFAITTHPELLLSTAEQGKVWEKALV